MENPDYDPKQPQILSNKRWMIKCYETGEHEGDNLSNIYAHSNNRVNTRDRGDESVFLETKYVKRKPFIVARGGSIDTFEYGQVSPTSQCIGLIQSLNKKAVSKDVAIEKMVEPGLQGPSNIKKSYLSSNSNTYIPIDPRSLNQGRGVSSIFEINNQLAPLVQEVQDERQQINGLFFVDLLLYLSTNPKTRTATEANAIVGESNNPS